MKRVFLHLWIMWIIPVSFAQDIELTLGQKAKTIKAGTFIEVILPSEEVEPCEACGYNFMTGKIISFDRGILTLDLYKTGELLVEDGKVVGSQKRMYNPTIQSNKVEIPKADIYSIIKKGNRRIRDSTPGKTVGIILSVIGFGHLVSIPFGKSNADLLGGLGAAELTLGLIMASSFNQKEYVTNALCPDKGSKTKKIWILD